jgi:prepilin-type N-terminal cleavage/methylation domain-containing protein
MCKTDKKSPVSRTGGFTLLELILVLVIISVLLGMAAPSLRGFFASRKAHDAAAGILSLIRYARSQAITEGRNYRLNLDPDDGVYWLTVNEAGGYAMLNTAIGRKYLLPEYTTMEVQMDDDDSKDDDASHEYIEFYPKGRADVCTIRIFDQSGDEVDVYTETPAERYRVVIPGEAG